MPSPIKIGLLGLGTVGQGVVKVLAANRMEIARRAGRDIIATKACVRDLDKARDVNIPLTANPMDASMTQKLILSLKWQAALSLRAVGF